VLVGWTLGRLVIMFVGADTWCETLTTSAGSGGVFVELEYELAYKQR
jgi:hypothetical protein